MPRRNPNQDFDIHVDPSCLSVPMDEELHNEQGDIEVTEDATPLQEDATHADLPETTVNDAADITNESVTSEKQDSEEDTSEKQTEVNEQEVSEASSLDGGTPTLPDVPDTSISESSLHEEVQDDEDDARIIADEESALPSIESRDGNDEEDISSVKNSSRRTSGRTEALIHAAARDIVARIENHHADHQENGQGDESMLSSHTDMSEDQALEQSEVSVEEVLEYSQAEFESQHVSDEGAESSSQHDGTDEDVFSDKSPRSSLGSYDGGSESGKGATIPDVTVSTRTPRISDISQYDHEDFIPTVRGTPRPPFRTPSDVRAMQMSSPPPSIFGSVIGSPRSSKRPFPTVSRLGSPAPSAQYSPKNRTPSRFKSKEAPLVLLHVTLLPLRWMWGDVVNNMDSFDLSEDVKSLREAWRILQDRMGDTVLERGILLGHPQNDYEVLEERLLEALDLPMRRRARILECGHYLGPSNENMLVDESESEDDYAMARPLTKRHWCSTCKSDIRYDSLGLGKIFRVKVYASNGLMRAGAWAACWKEMERVDIELEPIVEPSVSDELARLAAVQQEREASQQSQLDLASEIMQQIEDQQNASLSEQPDLMHAQLEIHSARPEHATDRRSMGEERRRLDEERLREIYGATPEFMSEVKEPDGSTRQRHPDSYVPPPSPRSPSEEAYERRETRRRASNSDSLLELLAQAAMKAMRDVFSDSRNLVIIVLGAFGLVMAMRHAPQQPQNIAPAYEGESVPQIQHVPMMDAPRVAEQQVIRAEPVVSYTITADSYTTQSAIAQESVVHLGSASTKDPCETQAVVHEQVLGELAGTETSGSATGEAVTQRTTVKVFETITETETMQIETITETETMKATVTVKDTPQVAKPTTEAVAAELDANDVETLRDTPIWDSTDGGENTKPLAEI